MARGRRSTTAPFYVRERRSLQTSRSNCTSEKRRTNDEQYKRTRKRFPLRTNGPDDVGGRGIAGADLGGYRRPGEGRLHDVPVEQHSKPQSAALGVRGWTGVIPDLREPRQTGREQPSRPVPRRIVFDLGRRTGLHLQLGEERDLSRRQAGDLRRRGLLAGTRQGASPFRAADVRSGGEGGDTR